MKSGRLEAIGIVQEQHPDRTVLFNQWKQLPMPLYADPLNRLSVTAVPILILADEQGIIRYKNPSVEQYRQFIGADYADQNEPASPAASDADLQRFREADLLAMQGEYDQALTAYRNQQPDSGNSLAKYHFRVGVVHRMRFDRDGDSHDFAKAIAHWRTALSIDPNQYIWRRRIQQYGPVLDKPYPFYRWIETARRAIKDRGETPVALAVEPAGAELAAPQSASSASAIQDSAEKPPDAKGQLARDREGVSVDRRRQVPVIDLQAVAVPSTDTQQQAARIHVLLTPKANQSYHWNNEAEPVMIWLETKADGVRFQQRLLTIPNPPVATSDEPRAAETEIRWSDNSPQSIKVRGYAIYNICDQQDGTCLIRRQDLELTVDASK